VTKPTAQVREVDGLLVIDDPDAVAVIAAIGKVNCTGTLEHQRERVEYFKGRMAARGFGPKDVVIVLLNVNDDYGGAVADVLMPLSGAAWDEMRARGEIPFARGLADRTALTEIVSEFDPDCAAKLRGISGVAVVVMDHGVVEVFPA
jgi:hypothetical protein